MQLTPVRNHNPVALAYTTIPMTCYQALFDEGFAFVPEALRFWAHRLPGRESCQTVVGSYPGAHHDMRVNGTPFLDIMQWDAMLAHLGFLPLPHSLNAFMGLLGVPVSKRAERLKTIVSTFVTFAFL
eukprot:449323-Prorocentrum_minimum.AAC.1